MIRDDNIDDTDDDNMDDTDDNRMDDPLRLELFDYLFLVITSHVALRLQVITYREYLPNVLGQQQMQKFDLELEIDSSRNYSYRDDVNPTANNVFGVAAFRFGHAEIALGTTPKEKYDLISDAFM